MSDRLATRPPEMEIHLTVTTTSAEAQKFFNQGLERLYAFNHDEAARSFNRALEFDSAPATAIMQR